MDRRQDSGAECSGFSLPILTNHSHSSELNQNPSLPRSPLHFPLHLHLPPLHLHFQSRNNSSPVLPSMSLRAKLDAEPVGWLAQWRTIARLASNAPRARQSGSLPGSSASSTATAVAATTNALAEPVSHFTG